jgi:hypothetical protein
MVKLLMPHEIRIVEAFTGFRSFDQDQRPDGVELLLQPMDSYGDPVKIAGTVRVELYTYLKASGDRKGERVCDPWELALLTEQDQKRYWNNVTGMYEIELKFPKDLRPSGETYVLMVTYNTPLSGHMTDEYVLAAPANVS